MKVLRYSLRCSCTVEALQKVAKETIESTKASQDLLPEVHSHVCEDIVMAHSFIPSPFEMLWRWMNVNPK